MPRATDYERGHQHSSTRDSIIIDNSNTSMMNNKSGGNNDDKYSNNNNIDKGKGKEGLYQICVLGTIFLLVFSSFQTVQLYASKLYGPSIDSMMLGTLYLVFSFSSLIAPAIVLHCGVRLSLFIGVSGYAALVGVSLLYFQKWVSSVFVILGGVINGFGASLLWSAQGRIMLGNTNDENRGFLVSVFWMFFMGAAVLGGVFNVIFYQLISADKNLGTAAGIAVMTPMTPLGIPPATNDYLFSVGEGEGDQANDGNDHSTPLFLFFFILSFLSGFLVLLLKPINDSDTTDDTSDVRTDDVLDTTAIEPAPSTSSKKKSFYKSIMEVKTESKQMFKLMLHDKYVPYFAVAMLSDGLYMPYVMSGFTRWFSKEFLGYGMIFYNIVAITGGFAIGALLDKKCKQTTAAANDDNHNNGNNDEDNNIFSAGNHNSNNNTNTRPLIQRSTPRSADASCSVGTQRRRTAMCIFTVICFVAYGIAMYFEVSNIIGRGWSYSGNTNHIKFRQDYLRSALSFIAFASFGLIDTFINSYVFWLIGSLYPKGSVLTRVCGFSKFIQSFGYFIGFIILPFDRVKPIIQISVAILLFGISIISLNKIKHTDEACTNNDVQHAIIVHDNDNDTYADTSTSIAEGPESGSKVVTETTRLLEKTQNQKKMH